MVASDFISYLRVFHRPVLKYPDDFEGRWPIISNKWEFLLANVAKQTNYKFLMERDTPGSTSGGKELSGFTSLKGLIDYNAWSASRDLAWLAPSGRSMGDMRLLAWDRRVRTACVPMQARMRGHGGSRECPHGHA